MMQAFLSDGRQVRILFKHERFEGMPQPHMRKHRQDLVWITGQTICRVVTGPREQEEVVAVGTARCSAADNFNKEKARQTALFHALGIDPRFPVQGLHQKLVLPIKDVGALLAAYFGRVKGQKRNSNTTTTEGG